MLPIELARSEKVEYADSAQVVLELRIDPDLFWFQGHFARQPLLPGVAQLDWVMHYAVELLAPQWCFSAIDNIKFQHPVLPGNRLRLTLVWHSLKHQLSFTYHIMVGEEARAASSGKIRLVPLAVVTPCP